MTASIGVKVRRERRWTSAAGKTGNRLSAPTIAVALEKASHSLPSLQERGLMMAPMT